ncbi:MAG: sigma-70 family RNA polymerase sigma factor [Thalassobaculaceae bacterium]|nr:sigma-70 family RNA polymerase sigma factor [Thalassobaculaceae bacterium]
MTDDRFPSLSQALEAYYGELRRYLLRRTGSSTVADDVIQETWLRARTTAAAMPDNPRAYLYRMVGNVATDIARRDAAQGKALTGVVEEQMTVPPALPDQAAESRQVMGLLVAAIEDLPPKCREVFLLYRARGLTMRQISLQLGISQKTVEKHIARAMLHCGKRLNDAGVEI